MPAKDKVYPLPCPKNIVSQVCGLAIYQLQVEFIYYRILNRTEAVHRLFHTTLVEGKIL